MDASGILQTMSAWSPTIEGFRTMFRRPAVSLAEVSWRWSFGAAAGVLLGLAILAYLDTLPVDRTDMILLRTGQPVLIGQAISHILHGSTMRVASASIILFAALALLWIFLASLGRGATLIPLLDHIRQRARAFAIDRVDIDSKLMSEDRTTWSISSLAGLNFLRAALTLAAIAGGIGAIILAGFASTPARPHPGTVFLLTSAMLLVLWLIWSFISWFLSVAAIFVVRQAEDTFGALSAAVDLCRDHFGPVIAVGTWFGLAHLVLFLAATSAVAFPFALVPAIPMSLVFTTVLLLTLAYFAIVDTLHIGRLASYVAILEAPPPARHLPILPSAPPWPPVAIGVQPETARVDQSELILSDTPSSLDAATSPSPSANLSNPSPLNEGTITDTESQPEATSPKGDQSKTENSEFTTEN